MHPCFIHSILFSQLINSLFPVGDSNCFLFSLSPTMAVYHPTGYNQNFMYLNMSTQTMPNGLVSHPQ